MSITNLQHLTALEHLAIDDCTQARALPELSSLQALRRLDIVSLRYLTSLESISELGALTHLSIIQCFDLIHVWLGSSLVELHLSDCWDLQDLHGAPELHALTRLRLEACRSLTELQLSDKAHLRHLEVVMCGLKRLSLGQLNALTRLRLGGCPSLERSPLIPDLPFLKELVIPFCDTLNHLPALSELVSLTKLEVEESFHSSGPYGLSFTFFDLHPADYADLRLHHLTALKIKGCCSLKQLQLGSELTSLRELRVLGASNLQQLQGLSHLTALTALQVDERAILTEASMRELVEVERGLH